MGKPIETPMTGIRVSLAEYGLTVLTIRILDRGRFHLSSTMFFSMPGLQPARKISN